jgi:hypothetical protein
LNTIINKLKIAVVCFSAFVSFSVKGQDANDAQKLAEIANNPLANAYKLFFQNVTLFGEPDNANVLYSNVVIPVNLGENWRLVNRVLIPFQTRRLTIPTTETLEESRIGNIEYQSIFVSKRDLKIGKSTLNLGIGPSVEFNTNGFDELATPFDDDWSLGLTALGVFKTERILGLLAVSPFWPVDSDNGMKMTLQYLLSYNFKSGTQIVSAPIIQYNSNLPGTKWEVPLGLGVGQIFKIAKIPFNFNAGAYYNVVRPEAVDDKKWSLGVNLMIILPSPALLKAMKENINCRQHCV